MSRDHTHQPAPRDGAFYCPEENMNKHETLNCRSCGVKLRNLIGAEIRELAANPLYQFVVYCDLCPEES